MENIELKELFNKFNEINSYQRDEQYFEIVSQIYEMLNLDINKIKDILEYPEEKILLKSIYLIEFYDKKILQKPINNLLYFIFNAPLMTINIKKDYIEQARLLMER